MIYVSYYILFYYILSVYSRPDWSPQRLLCTELDRPYRKPGLANSTVEVIVSYDFLNWDIRGEGTNFSFSHTTVRRGKFWLVEEAEKRDRSPQGWSQSQIRRSAVLHRPPRSSSRNPTKVRTFLILGMTGIAHPPPHSVSSIVHCDCVAVILLTSENPHLLILLSFDSELRP